MPATNPMNVSQPSQESDIESDPNSIEDGYCVKLYVYGDGSFGIGEPEAIAPDEEDDEGSHIADLTSALKRLLNVVKQNPVGSDEDAQFDAGYNPGGVM